MKYSTLQLGQIEALGNILGGMETIQGILRGEVEVTLTVIKRLLACEVSFDPASFIGAEWAPWRGAADGKGLEGDIYQDERSLTLTEIDWVKVTFQNFLKENEPSITGEEKLKRQKEAGHVRFGGNVFLSLWQDYQKNKKDSVLEWLHRTHGITFLDFFGLILRVPNGSRFVLYLYRNGGEWSWDCNYLEDDWHAHDLSGVPASDSTQASVPST